jgi:hypothetical protein
MPETTSAFDHLVPRLEQIRERVELSPPDEPVTLSRDDVLVVLEMVGRMARGFQVLERRGLR